MTTNNSNNIYLFFKQCLEEFAYLIRSGLRSLERTPLPHLLVTCLALAIFISVLPLALSLFVLFVLLKLLGALTLFNVRKNRQAPARLKQSD
ncbi:hypothetical protein H8K47_14615 [Undibacterium sp. CY7W]|uniref:Uncharacterized protein n=1 Tax=Undibacterium rugosum TaxID=2762291 RepID=A0A923I4W6_9BURK|nr:hypothetical protein [Undibacterium rugosum]MBC3936597.1 hypothetical protein [Undibacterium rugosum]